MKIEKPRLNCFRFQTTYGTRAQTALPYAMNSDFSVVMAAEMKAFSEPARETDRLSRVQGQVEDLRQIMVRNIGKNIFFKQTGTSIVMLFGGREINGAAERKIFAILKLFNFFFFSLQIV